MSTIFTRIMEGEIPGHVVWTDEVCAVFLDIEPLTPGHALVVPRAEVDHWVDLPEETTAHLMQVAARVGRAQLRVFGSDRVGVIVQGFEVPHAHVHVFPTSDPADFDLGRKGPRDQDDLAADAAALRGALAQG
ncbi:HIT family hydrolase [Serinicoccus chungangensis]|uniref:HIT family hydrolase n=1 Tax=Serinicoccus chungangensis TaxID=767452 RepID=A0A0W8I7M7_9MICO|nr:HIT family protein [Serinicoccus chungangensis]KUG54394.1 HIT family hydrolase [Serinicoccus chungangensis]